MRGGGGGGEGAILTATLLLKHLRSGQCQDANCDIDLLKINYFYSYDFKNAHFDQPCFYLLHTCQLLSQLIKETKSSPVLDIT